MPTKRRCGKHEEPEGEAALQRASPFGRPLRAYDPRGNRNERWRWDATLCPEARRTKRAEIRDTRGALDVAALQP